MSKANRLHPVAIGLNLIQLLKAWVFYIILGFITIRGQELIYFFLLLAAFLILLLTISVLKWYRFTYQIEGDELRIEYGIFVRKKRYISKNRIHSIDLTANVIHRMFQLVHVKIETAGSGTDAEASLQAVKRMEGERIREAMKRGPSPSWEGADINGDATGYLRRTISTKHLLIAGITSGSTGIILAILGALFSELEQFIPDSFYNSMLDWFIRLSLMFIVLLIVIVIAVIWLIGIVGTMMKYWKFTITKVHDEFIITRGLLEKKQITIPLKRIQAIGIQESILRQPFGFVTVFVEVAGSTLDKGEDFSTVLFPIMKKSEVSRFLEKFSPEHVLPEEDFISAPKRGVTYYLIRAVILPIILGGLILYFLPVFSWVMLLLFPVFIYLGVLRHKDTGFLIRGKQLVIRYRVVGKNTMILDKNRIQSFEKKQHVFHQKDRLATMKLSIIARQGSARYRLKELELEDVNRLAEWYSRR